MNAGLQVVLSGALTFGVPLVVAIHQLLIMRRPNRDGWGGDGPPGPNPGLLPGNPPKRLPECLIPKLPPVSADRRVPERL